MRSSASRKKLRSKKIYLISDSTGELSHRFTNALVTQFPGQTIETERYNFVREIHEAKKLIAGFSDKDSIVFHTVISQKLKKAIGRLTLQRKIPSFDLTGPPTQFMAEHFKIKPNWNVGAVHPVDDDYDRRIGAIEFAIEHDDGAGAATLKKADIILVGPSRCSKTPTTMYLAVKGYRVANIPLIPELHLSENLLALKGDPRVLAFMITPEKLYQVRKKRAAEMGSQAGRYTNLSSILKEIEWSSKLYRQQRWQTIDVTDRAIEETAALIIKRIEKNGKSGHRSDF